MRIISTAILIILSLLTMSCSNLSQRQVTTWMDSKSEPPEINVSGSWQSVNSLFTGGWGNAVLTQNESQVNGTLGLYTVEGRVAGKKLFLMILSGNRVYYTAMIEPTKEGTLSGMAYSKILPDDPEFEICRSRTNTASPFERIREHP